MDINNQAQDQQNILLVKLCNAVSVLKVHFIYCTHLIMIKCAGQ